MDYSNLINELEIQIQENQKQNKDIIDLVNKQIFYFEQARTELKNNISDGKIRYDIDIAGIEIEQLQALILLSKRINKPTEEYENLIKEIENEFIGNDVELEISEVDDKQ